MPGTYASATDVPVSRSRDEIERILTRFGASEFAYFTNSGGEVAIAFSMHNVRVLMRMRLPDRESFRLSKTGFLRADSTVEKEWEQACRQRWRSLANGIKAKLALIDDGISTVEREFLADVLLPNGQTYGEFAVPQIAEVYRTQEMPALLPGATPPAAKVIALQEGRRNG